MLNHKNVGGLGPVNPRAVLSVNAGEVERLTPPHIHMGFGEPPLKQRKVGSAKRPE